MKLSRRGFMIGSAATALVPVLPFTAKAYECPRQKAFRLADRIVKEYAYRDTSDAWIHTSNYFFDHLLSIPAQERSLDEIKDEILAVMYGVGSDQVQRDVDIMNCSNEAFATTLARDLIKNKKIWFTKQAGFETFFNRYGDLIMTTVRST